MPSFFRALFLALIWCFFSCHFSMAASIDLSSSSIVVFYFSPIPHFLERVLPVPTFSNSLPKRQEHQGFDLRRTPPSKPLTAICTCESILCCDTHYWHGRTLPCERLTNSDGKTIDDTNCQACQQKQPFRTHVYVSAFDAKSHEHFLFECTAMAAKPFEEYIQSVGSLRGCGFQATRPKGGPNSKVVIVTATANLARITLPNAPDIPSALSVIWRLPRSAFSVPDLPFSPPTISTEGSILDRMRNQPDNVGDPPTIGEIIGANGSSKKKR